MFELYVSKISLINFMIKAHTVIITETIVVIKVANLACSNKTEKS